MRRDGDPLAGLASTDRTHLAFLDLAGLEGTEACEDHAVAGCQGLANAIKHGVEGRVSLRARASQLSGNPSSQVSLSQRCQVDTSYRFSFSTDVRGGV